MANNTQNISGLRGPSALPIIAGRLRPNQEALLRAWQAGQLPQSAQRFMDLVRAGTQKTGRSRDIDKATASQIPDRLARQLAALRHPAGVQQFAAQILFDAPAAGHTSLKSLAQSAVLPAAQTQQVSQALGVSVARGSPVALMTVLSNLPYKVAQSILDSHNAAINAFLKAWSEDLAINAELNAKAAKKAAELAAQAQLTQRHATELSRAAIALNVKKQGLVQANRKLDATSAGFAKMLLNQAVSVLNNTLALVGASAIVATPFLVDRSLDSAERGSKYVAQLAPTFNLATLDALDAPEDDLGPRLGFKRGRQGIQG